MRWIDRRKKEPDPKIHKIIYGYCDTCKNVHMGFFDYGTWCIAEKCYESGKFFTGEDLDFTYWALQPKPPKYYSLKSIFNRLKNRWYQKFPKKGSLARMLKHSIPGASIVIPPAKYNEIISPYVITGLQSNICKNEIDIAWPHKSVSKEEAKKMYPDKEIKHEN